MQTSHARSLCRYFLLGCLAIITISSCSSTKAIIKSTAGGKNIYKEHILEVDPDGLHIERSLNGSGKINQQEHLASIISGLDQHLDSGHKKIMLFVHGGLNSRKAAFKRAMRNAPAIARDSIYPIFVNWNSGGLSSYGQQLFTVSGGVEYKHLKKVMFPFVAIQDLVTGIVKIPVTGFNNATSNWNTNGVYDPARNSAAWNVTRRNTLGIYKLLEKRMVADPGRQLAVSWGADERKKGTKVMRGLVSFVVFPTRLAGLPFYDGMGTQAWVNMKRRAKALYHPGCEFDLRQYLHDDAILAGKLDRHHEGVMAMLVDTLNSYLKSRSSDSYELTLMGHSMGAIVINELLLQYPDLPVSNIVHMGAASSVGAVNSAVIPYLSAHRDTRFYNLSLNPMAENRENALKFFLIPHGSLLVHIDNMFEQHASFLDRTSGRWENIIQATHLFPDSVRSQVTLKCFPVKNHSRAITHQADEQQPTAQKLRVFQPQKHGQFDDDVYWLEDFWKVVPSEVSPLRR
jgi:pimeloyl-ACP methyl ester carboxylesterase